MISSTAAFGASLAVAAASATAAADLRHIGIARAHVVVRVVERRQVILRQLRGLLLRVLRLLLYRLLLAGAAAAAVLAAQSMLPLAVLWLAAARGAWQGARSTAVQAGCYAQAILALPNAADTTCKSQGCWFRSNFCARLPERALICSSTAAQSAKGHQTHVPQPRPPCAVKPCAT